MAKRRWLKVCQLRYYGDALRSTSSFALGADYEISIYIVCRFCMKSSDIRNCIHRVKASFRDFAEAES